MHDPLKTWMLTPTTVLFMFSFTNTSHQLPKETNALTCAKPIPYALQYIMHQYHSKNEMLGNQKSLSSIFVI